MRAMRLASLCRLVSSINDPRSTGLALNLLSWIAMVLTDSYAEALEYSEQSLSVAVTPFDRIAAALRKGMRLGAAAADRRGRQVVGRAASRRCWPTVLL